MQYYESSHHAFTDRTAVATRELARRLGVVLHLNGVLCNGKEDNINDCPLDGRHCYGRAAGVICPDGN